MNAFSHSPESNPTDLPKSSEQPSRSAEEVRQEREASVRIVSSVRQKEAQSESRITALEDIVMGGWEHTGDGHVLCFGVPIPEDHFPDVIARKLVRYEQEQGTVLNENSEQSTISEALTQALKYEETPLDDVDEGDEVVPSTVMNWLTENCPPNLHASVCQQYTEMASQADLSQVPLDALLPRFVEIAVKRKHNASLDETIAQIDSETETEQEAGRQLDTTIDVLKNDIARAAEGYQGREQITAVKEFIATKVNDPELKLSDQAKSELVSWINGIEATVNQMALVVSGDPVKAQALETIFASTSLNLTGADNYEVFSDVMAKVDASGQFSEDDKRRLRVEGLGIPPFRDSTQMLNTIEAVRNNDGKFLNPKTGRVDTFGEDNGIPVGRYTVYPDPKDQSELVATVDVGGRQLRVPFSPERDPSYLDELISAAMITQVLANRDFQAANKYVLGGDGLAAQGVTEINLDEFQVKRAEKLYGAFMGFGTELRTGFPDQSELQSFEWRLQSTHIDQDARTNDNTGRGDLSWEKIGMLENGQVQMDKVEEVGAFLNTKSTALPSFDQLVEKFGNEKTEHAN